MRSRLLAVVIILGLLLSTPGLAQADGIIIPDPPPGVPPSDVPNLWVRFHRVEVEIGDQVATTRVDQVFVNQADYDLEGIYVFPLPEDSAISDFAMYVDGKRWEGELLPKEEARRIYEDIVRRQMDPALLEYVGRDTFRASIFPIPPQGERRIEISYSQILKAEDGLFKYIYPLDTERFSSQPLEEVVISLDIRSSHPIKAIYSPSHEIAIERLDEYHAEVSFEASNITPDKDFELYYSISEEDFGLSLLTYNEDQEDGFFLLLLAPKAEVESEEVVAKDILFVLDVSGSMDGEKIEQAKEALGLVLAHLNPEDRFNIIAFSTGLDSFARELQPAKEREEAYDFIADLEAVGGTDIYRAVMEALEMARAASSRERPQILIFLTDGQPTEGVTEIERIIEDVNSAAQQETRIFTFGVGDDVNTVLLDAMAQDNRGASAYVRPSESIEEEVSSFYAKVSTPLLSNIELDFGDIRVEDVYPYPLPDLFLGSQLMVAGRYHGSSRTLIVLKGEINGEAQEFVYEASFAREGGEKFIPRLWATRKVGYLLNQIKLHGEDKELVEEIVDLSIRYGIMTPYTSFLVDEDVNIFEEEGRDKAEMQVYATPVPMVGAPAVEDSEAREALGGSERAVESQVVKEIGGKVFILRNGVWTDSIYDNEETVKVGFASEDYFRLLSAHPEWGQYFSVGQRVIVVLDGVTYEVVEGDAPHLTIPPSNPPTRELGENLWDFVQRLLGWLMNLIVR